MPADRLPAAAVAPTQLDLFPERPVVEVLDPRALIGPRTATTDVVRVRLRSVEAAHLVFHDRHGWYCDTHGPACEAVSVARSVQISGAEASGEAAPEGEHL